MQYREFAPCDQLRPLIRSYWTLEGRNSDPQPQLVFPDGHMEMIFHLADPFELLSNGAGERQANMLLAGQIWEPLQLRPGRSVDVVAVKFQPGGAAAFLRFPQQEVAGTIVSLDELWGSRARAVRDALGEAEPGEARIRRIEELLLALRPKAPPTIGLLSERQYRRRFEEMVGVPPKLHQRIRRFQRALETLGQRPFVEVAQDCGYYDQAHLIRDFKGFTGMTPAAWLRGQQNVLFFQDALDREGLL